MLDTSLVAATIGHPEEEETAIPVPALAIIPLDDRPCNRLFPQQLAAIGGWDVLMPQREALGWFTEPGDCASIADWLGETSAEGFVVSLDMLCFGGLVASRTLATELEEALGRLEPLRMLRESRPDAALFAFSTITRLGKTVARGSDLQTHELLRLYSQLLDRVERLGEQDARTELALIEDKLEPDVLGEYLQVRRRNHAVNRAAVRLVADGVLDYLVLSQEDAAPVGIHIPEQLALRGQIEEFRVGDKVTITPGADEVGLLLMARHCTLAADDSIGIALDYAADLGADVFPAFESQPLRETAEASIAAAGARVAAPVDADAILFVHTPVDAQPDITQAPPRGQSPALSLQAESLAERVEAAAGAGRVVGIADVAYCNGADPELVAALQRRDLIGKINALAGWNTAANTLGTAVSQLCMTAAAKSAGCQGPSEAARQFIAARLVDDYLYQSEVRQKAVARARELGADQFWLGEHHAELEQFVNSEIAPLARDLRSSLGSATLGNAEVSIDVLLPWRRLFEVEVRLSAT